MDALDRRSFLKRLGAGTAVALIPPAARAAEPASNGEGPQMNPYRQDLEFMFQTILDVHPKPDWRVPMSRLEAEMQYARLRADSCETVLDFCNIARRFLHVMSDAHTFLTFPPSVRVLVAPIETTFVENRVVVADVLRVSVADGLVRTIERGDVLLAIGGEETERRLENIMSHSAYNTVGGVRRGVARACLEFADWTSGDVEIVLAKAGGDVVKVSVPLLEDDDPELMRARMGRRPSFYRTLIEARFLDDLEAGCFNYRACGERRSYDNPRDKEMLRQRGLTLDDVPDMEESAWAFFAELHRRGWHRLIIDLRGNVGGDARIGQHLFKYLTRRDLATYTSEKKISRQLQEVDEGARQFAVGAVRTDPDNVIRYPYRSRLDDARLTTIRQFEGDVVVLIDELVFSSGEWLAVELRANDIGAFVGEPTGGGGSAPGQMLTFTLPRSNLQLGVPYKFFHVPEGLDEAYPGVLPDYCVRQSLDDFRAGRDTVMEFVKRRWA